MALAGHRAILPLTMIPISVVDAFTRRPFSGNPAAVCRWPEGQAVTDDWLQSIAAELNLSETAFLFRRVDGGWDLRWFTPTTEVDLCGHATLAAAHALWESGTSPTDAPLRFLTRSGWLTCERRADGIALDFPARPPQPYSAPQALWAGLRMTASNAVWVGRDVDDALVELPDEAAVRSIQPDFGQLASVPVRGVIVTAPAADPAYDFVSRFFAPRAGIPEDPVTGSAHCALAVHWSRRLGRNLLHGWQASARGGAVDVELRGDRVTLIGQAVTTWRGEWLIPPVAG